ncbi:MAG: hypothetical protein U9Q69_04005 [Nanoarchaeota archaeon]|nr:hypothetical protein [Nanoarchaeota archaeon]
MVNLWSKLKRSVAPLFFAATVLTGCYETAPTVPLKKDYPELTDERKSELVSELKESIEDKAIIVKDETKYGKDENITEFSGSPQEYINRLTTFRKADNRTAGVSYPDIEDMEIAIVSKDRINRICGEHAVACNGQDKIYMPNDLRLRHFLPLLYHEMGHSYFFGAKEYPAVANEIYMAIKSYQFTKSIASISIFDVISGKSEVKIINQTPFYMMYVKAALYAVYNLIRHSGDIEKATDSITHSKDFIIETALAEKLAETEGENPTQKYFHLWNELLDNYNFRNYLSGERGHLSYSDANELVDFIRISNYQKHTSSFPNQQEIRETTKNLESSFLYAYYGNPFFRAHVSLTYSQKIGEDLETAKIEKGINSEEVYNLAKELIIINSNYPCSKKDPYKCPKKVRFVHAFHPKAYYQIIQSAFGMGDSTKMARSSGYAQDFIERFYPNIDFDNGQFDTLDDAVFKETNNYLPPIAFYAGTFYESRDNSEKAMLFFDAATRITCVSDGAGDYNECLYYKDEAKKKN